MYTDTILFIVGGVCALIAISLGIYIIISTRQSRSYQAILQQETEIFDALTIAATFTANTRVSVPSLNATESLSNIETTPEDRTSLILDYDRTEFSSEQTDGGVTDFDDSALEGRYKIISEIHGGGMSRIFLAESVKLGNHWIVKFISNQTGQLANEENILKLLNHISLPKIIDIFHDDKGIYIIESYIEGISLDKVMESGQKINQVITLDWAEQLAQVLNYLHKMEPHPIYHYDLKPSNIMVTHDNRLVLIDFGISKRFGEDNTDTVGVTYKYAAPEQLKHRIPERHMPIIESRFGELPADRLYWNSDARTDIYSLGVILFEIAVGQIPSNQTKNMLKDVVSHEMYNIINKCLALNPDERYQSASELLLDLQKNKGSKVKMARTLFMRKFAIVSSTLMIIISGGTLAGGYYVYGQENAALLGVDPEIMIVSYQQSSELKVEKEMPNGNITLLENSEIRWSFSEDNIAHIDGNRIAGMNLGKTELFGKYRNKGISLKVKVVEPMDGMVNISHRYESGHYVELFAGTIDREHKDGTLEDAEFVSPESIAIAEDGAIYVVDSGLLRKIKDGKAESISFEPEFLTPHIVRCYKNDVYVLTNAWEEDDGAYYGIIKLTEDGAEGLYMADAKFTNVEDFTFCSDGLLYFIDRNEGVGSVSLKMINLTDVEDIITLCDLPKGTSTLTMDHKGSVYLANPETGAIQVYKDGKLEYFAGVEKEKAFIDGTAPLFYMPQKIKYSDDFLYVWDFNILRRISIKEGVAVDCITIAGEASPTFELDIVETEQSAEEIVLPNSKLMDFIMIDKSILLTDSKRGVIWRIK